MALRLVAVVAALVTGAVRADTLYWSGTTGTSSPLWSTVGAWSTISGGWSAPASIPGASDDAVFSITPLVDAQIVRLGGDQAVRSLTFTSTAATTLLGGSAGSPADNTLTLGIGGITTATGAGPVTIGSASPGNVSVALTDSQTWTVGRGSALAVVGGVVGTAVSGASQTLTVGGPGSSRLSGVIGNGASGGVLNLTLAGSSGGGRLDLTNAANTYSGTTTVSYGQLVVSSNGALGAGTSPIVVQNTASRATGGGMLVLDGRQAGITLSRNLSLSGQGVFSENTSGALFSVGANTITGSVAAGVTTSTRVINTGNLAFGPTSNLNVNNTVSLGYYSMSGVNNVSVTGTLSGNGTLQRAQGGTLFLSPTDSSNFSGFIKTEQGGANGTIRITSTGAIGSRTGSGANAVFQLNSGHVEVRMDTPSLQTTTGSNADVNLTVNSNVFVDHALGSTQTGQTLSLSTYTIANNRNGQVISRNGYGMSMDSYTIASGSATLQNNLAGTLTITGSFLNTANTTANNTHTVTGNGNTVVNGNVIAANGTGLQSLTKSGAGSLTIKGIGSTINGTISVQGGGLVITDFRSITNNTGTVSLGASTTAGALIVGTDITATAAGLDTSKAIDFAGTTGTPSIYANQAGTNPVVLRGTITASGSGAKTFTLGGSNTADNLITAAIPDGTGSTVTSLQKLGAGTWVLSGANTFTGAASIANGTLKLNATAAASDVLKTGGITFNADSVLQSAGGTLSFTGFSNATTTETLGALTPTAGAGNVVVTNNGGASTTLTFGSLGTRGTGATLNYAPGTNAAIVFTSQPVVTNGIIAAASGGAAFQTFNGVDWATATSGTVQQFTAYNTTLPANGTAGSGTNFAVSTGTSTTGAATINTLKLVGGSSPPTLTLGGTLTLSAKGVLFDNSSGAGTITNSQLGGDGVETVVITAGSTPANALTINSLIGSGAGSLTKAGSGTLVVGGANTFTGNVVINEGTVQLSGATATLGTISTAANATTLLQGATLDVNAAGVSNTVTIGALTGAGMVTNSGAGAATAGTLAIGSASSIAAGTFSGVLQNGAGVLNVTKNGSGNQSLLGQSTYTGVTTINAGTLTVDRLADGGQASGIGQSGSAASNLVFSGTSGLVYQGNIMNGSLVLGSQSARTNRLFTIAGTGTTTLASNVSNSNALVWTNTGAIAHSGTAARTLAFDGTSIGDNAFLPQITDSGSSTNITSVFKTGTGIWILGSASNSYTGVTTIANGFLGFATAGSLPSNSPVSLGTTTTAAVLMASGTFDRSLGASATAGNGTVTMAGTGGSGFAALGEKLVVAIGGAATPTALTWGSGGFNPSSLILGSAYSPSETEFRNAINLGGSARTITVNDNANTAADFATLSGVISGAGGLVKAGTGLLVMSGGNTYSGTTAVTGGTLVVQSLGSSAAPATASSVGSFTAGDAGAVSLSPSAGLSYTGGGETSDRRIILTGGAGSSTIDSSGVGPLVLSDIVNNSTGAKTLNLRGSNIDDNTISANLADSGANILSVTLDTAGKWVLSGSNSFKGTLTLGNSNSAYPTGGTLGIATDSLLASSGTFSIAAGTLFAVGADRTIAATTQLVNFSGSQIVLFGDYGLTFSGTTVSQMVNSTQTLTSNVASGKSLTFNAMTFNSGTAAIGLTVNGTGDTSLGPVTSSTSWPVNLSKSAAGRLTLTGSNGAFGTVTVSAGVLNVQNADALGGTGTNTVVSSGAALEIQGGITIAAEPLSLNGTGVSAGGALRNVSGTNVFGGPITLAAATRINSDAGLLTLNSGSAIAGNYGLTFGGSGSIQVASAIGTSSGAVTKDGAGTLTLSASNSYTGATTINAGRLALSGVGTLGATGSSSLTLGGGQLDLGTLSTTVGNVSVTTAAASGDTIQNGTLTGTAFAISNATGTATISAVLAGTANLTKTGTGTTILTATNTYTAATTINSGVVSVSTLANGGVASGIGASASAAGNLVLGGGSLQYTGTTVSIDRAFQLTASTTSAIDVSTAGTTLTFTGSTANTTGALTKAGAGTLALAGPAAYTGATAINAGTLQIGNGSTTGGLSSSSAISIASGATLAFSRTDNYGGNFANTISGSGGLAVLSGSLTLSKANTYTGQTTVNGGVLAAGIANAFGSSAPLALNSGTVNLGGFSQSVGALSGSAGTLITTSTGAGMATLTTTVASGISTFAGTIANNVSGTVAFTKAGAGTQVLSGSNSYTGTTNIDAGTLALSGAGTLGATSNSLVLGGGSLDLGGLNVTVGNVSGTAAFASGNTIQNGTLSGTAFSFSNTTGTAMISAILAGTANLTKTGAGTTTLSAANSYTGTTNINAGTLALSGAGTLGATSNSLVLAGGALDLGGLAATVGQVSGTGTVASATPISNGTLSGTSFVFSYQTGGTVTISASLAGSGALKKDTSASTTLVLSGSNSYTGGTTITTGTILLSGQGTLGSATNSLVLGGGSLDLGGLSASAGNVSMTSAGNIQNGTLSGTAFSFSHTTGNSTISATLAGTADLTKTNAGTLALSNSNSYVGNTTLSAGTLILGNAAALGATSGTLSLGGGALQASATLTGANKIMNPVAFTAQSTVSGANTIEFGGPVSWTTGNTIGFNGTTIFSGSVALNGGNGGWGGSGSVTISGPISGASTFGINGSGTMTLSGSNSFTGQLIIAPQGGQNSTVIYTRASAINSASSILIGGTATAGTLVYTGAGDTITKTVLIGDNAARGGTATLDQSGSGLLVYQSVSGSQGTGGWVNSLILQGSTSGTGQISSAILTSKTVAVNVTKQGSSTWILSGSNTYTGATAINVGTLQIGNSDTTSALSVSSVITGSAGATLAFNRTNAVAQGTDFSHAITGGLGFAQVGSGTLTLSGSNTYTGPTTASTGVLRFDTLAAGSGAQSLGSGSVVNLGVASTSAGELNYFGSGGTLDKNVFALGNGRNRIRNSGAGTLTLSGSLTKNGTILELAGGTFSVTGQITGTSQNSDLYVNGASVTLTNTNNDYNGPTYVYGGGTLTLGASGVIPNGSALLLGGTGSDTGSGRIVTGTFTDTVASLTTSTLGGTVGITISGATAGGLTTGNLTFGGSTDTLALTLSGLNQTRYTLLTYTGLRSGTFDVVTGNGNYNVVYGAASNGTIDLQLKATQATSFTLAPAAARVLVGGSTTLSGVLANSSPTGAASLAWNPTVTGSLSGVASSLGSSITAGGTSTITATFLAGNTAGSQNWSLVNTDNNAIQTTSTASGSIDVVNQRTFSVSNSGTINLGNFLRTSAVTGSTAISSSGLYDTTSSASLGAFSGTSTNGFSLALATGTNVFDGGSAFQQAVYSLSGSAAVAGAMYGSFTSPVTAELGSIDPISVTLVGTAYDPAKASFASGLMTTSLLVDIGEFNQNTGAHTAGFSIYNLLTDPTFTADLKLLSITDVGTPSNSLSIDLSPGSFSDLMAGGTSNWLATLTSGATGSFSNQYQLNFVSSKNGQSLGGPQSMTLTVTGIIVVPEPGTLALAGIGIGLAGWLARKRRRGTKEGA